MNKLTKFGALAGILMILAGLFTAFCWVWNLVKLCKCDFDAPYKDEIIHAIGLIPGFSIVTCWF